MVIEVPLADGAGRKNPIQSNSVERWLAATPDQLFLLACRPPVIVLLRLVFAVTSVDILRNPDAVADLDDNAREAVQKRIQALQNGLATVLKQIQAPGK
jgi:hypothetical protein